MDTSRMKNIIVLKDLPSNIVDEAIVILKNGIKVKNKEIIESKKQKAFEDNVDGNYEVVIKEAEALVDDYIKRLEKPKELTSSLNIKRMKLQYKKMQICSILLGVTTIVRNNN